MEELSSFGATRSQWSKNRQANKLRRLPPGKETAVVLPALLARDSSSRRLGGSGNSSKALHSLLSGNERESYSRTQLRAVANGRTATTSNNNNLLTPSQSRSHSKPAMKTYAASEGVERLALAPLDHDSAMKSRTARGALPDLLQAAIDQVLAQQAPLEPDEDEESNSSERRSNNEEEWTSTLSIAGSDTSSVFNGELRKRRAKMPRHIHGVKLSKSMRGTTLARYRRLVGMVARHNLARSYAGATMRVVTYRLELHSVVAIQRMVSRFLRRRQQTKALERNRAAAGIQRYWRRALESDRQRKEQEEKARHAQIVQLTQHGAARTVQRVYARYRVSCLLHKAKCEQERAVALERARLQLLRRYQSWRNHSTISPSGSAASTSVSTPIEWSTADQVVTPLQAAGKTHAILPCDCSHEAAPSDSNAIAEDSTATMTANGGGKPAHIERYGAANVMVDGIQSRMDAAPLGTLGVQTTDLSTSAPRCKKHTRNMLDTEAPSRTPVRIIKHAGPAERAHQWEQKHNQPDCSVQVGKVAPPPASTANEANADDDYKSNDEDSEDIGHAEAPVAMADQTQQRDDLRALAIAASAVQTIARFLLPKVLASRIRKGDAALQIQRHVRSYLAKHLRRKPRPKRKPKTYLSAKQKASRKAYAAFESNVLNLTLDMNEIRQQVRLLEERRDLHVMRLMLARQHFQSDVLGVMDSYNRVFGALSRRRTSNELPRFLARVHPEAAIDRRGSLPFFVWQWGCYNNRFHHWKYTNLSNRIVTYVEDDDVTDGGVEQDESRQPCDLGGCVVESVGEFSGRPTRAMVAAMFPHLLSDEGFTALLTEQTMVFPTRIFLYFDSHGHIVNHVLEADAFAALHAIVDANVCNVSRQITDERFTDEVTSFGASHSNESDVDLEVDTTRLRSEESTLPESEGETGASDTANASSRSRHAVDYLLS
ncbi:hypothetical protein BBJ28_00016353 [Nothophytophthora sp. Chile5]|nr:hypothetical protein BBJ28_00016353 [Nothophytophthora sp. Chile5]